MTAATPAFMIHADAQVAGGVHIGDGTKVWSRAVVREQASIGDECIIGSSAFVDTGVRIGNRCKIQNQALLYAPATLEDGVFIGPGAILTNDRHPRAITADGALKLASDWTIEGVTISYGASVGAGAIVLPGLTIGRWALIASGAVVAKDVPDHALIVGVPGRQVGWVGRSGARLTGADTELVDPETGDRFRTTDAGIQEIT